MGVTVAQRMDDAHLRGRCHIYRFAFACSGGGADPLDSNVYKRKTGQITLKKNICFMKEATIVMKESFREVIVSMPYAGAEIANVILYPITGGKPKDALDPDMWEIPDGCYAVRK